MCRSQRTSWRERPGAQVPLGQPVLVLLRQLVLVLVLVLLRQLVPVLLRQLVLVRQLVLALALEEPCPPPSRAG